jgi:hypothetical protein
MYQYSASRLRVSPPCIFKQFIRIARLTVVTVSVSEVSRRAAVDISCALYASANAPATGAAGLLTERSLDLAHYRGRRSQRQPAIDPLPPTGAPLPLGQVLFPGTRAASKVCRANRRGARMPS